MSGQPDDDTDKSHDPTPQKLQRAREKGDVARSTDLSVAAAYAGLLLALLAAGQQSVGHAGTAIAALLDYPDRLAPLVFDGSPQPVFGEIFIAVAAGVAPWFGTPAALVLLSILAQRALVFAPSKIAPKASRISLLSNARNKFGRSGLFEFGKSFTKLVLYSVCLGLFLRVRLPEILVVIDTSPRTAVALLARLCLDFLFLTLLIAIALGAVDAVWQYHEHRRKNRMSRKEISDEVKESEGDPHVKQARRFRAQSIAANRMMAEIPGADVVIVNPTHFAVALTWSRATGSAPVCVAKGVDEIAAAIRDRAERAGVPIHRDPATARSIHATIEIGQEITEDLYAPVAAAIRFAERMRERARERGW